MRLLEYLFLAPGEGATEVLTTPHSLALRRSGDLRLPPAGGDFVHIAEETEEQLCVVAKRPALGRPMRNSDLFSVWLRPRVNVEAAIAHVRHAADYVDTALLFTHSDLGGIRRIYLRRVADLTMRRY